MWFVYQLTSLSILDIYYFIIIVICYCVGLEPFCDIGMSSHTKQLNHREGQASSIVWENLPGLRNLKIFLGNFNRQRANSKGLELSRNWLCVLTGLRSIVTFGNRWQGYAWNRIATAGSPGQKIKVRNTWHQTQSQKSVPNITAKTS